MASACLAKSASACRDVVRTTGGVLVSVALFAARTLCGRWVWAFDSVSLVPWPCWEVSHHQPLWLCAPCCYATPTLLGPCARHYNTRVHSRWGHCILMHLDCACLAHRVCLCPSTKQTLFCVLSPRLSLLSVSVCQQRQTVSCVVLAY